MALLALPVCPVNHVFNIETRDVIMSNKVGDLVTIKSPSAHIGEQQLQLRLMSNCYRLGQVFL